MLMRSDNAQIQKNRIIDELTLLWRILIQNFLNHVITIEILDKLDHIRLKTLYQDPQLMIIAKAADDLLQCPRPVLVNRYLK